jgi:hypothetical protein
MASPTITTAGKRFVVINNDTSTHSITVNSIVLAAGDAQIFVWDGTVWIAVEMIYATTTSSGMVTLATEAEVVSGSDPLKVVTPSTLTSKMSSPGAIGNTAPSTGSFTTLGASNLSNNYLFVDGSRADTYTADGSMLLPFKTVLAALAVVNANIGQNWVIKVSPGTYSDNLTITGPRFLRIEGEGGVVLSGTILINSGVGTYDRIEFVGVNGLRAEKGPALTISGAITATRANDSLIYVTFDGCFISGSFDTVTNGTWVLSYRNCRVNGTITGTFSEFTGTAPFQSSILIESYGFNEFVGTISGITAFYNCHDSDFYCTINTVPEFENRFSHCTFAGSVSIIPQVGASSAITYVDGVSYKQLKARTPTLTGVTLSHIDGGVMLGATTEILVGGGDGTNPVWTTATGTGAPARADNPTFTTPVLGAATATSVEATTFDTGVVAAKVTLSGTTLAADGTDAAINIAITPKGTGEVDINKVDIDGGAIDGTIIGASSAAAATFTEVTTSSIVASANALTIKPTTDAVTAVQIQKANGSNILNVDTTNGRIGIGIDAPLKLLHLSAPSPWVKIKSTTNGYTVTDYETDTGIFRIGKEGVGGGDLIAGTTPYAGIISNGGDYPINVITNGTTKLFIKGDGNIGIGTTSPTNILSLGNASARKFWIENTATDVVGRALTIAAGSTVLGTAVDDVVGGNLILSSGAGTGIGASSILFQTGTTLTTGKTLQSITTKMSILGNGKVGIGTQAPLSTLSINGGVHVGGDSDAGDDNLLVDGTVSATTFDTNVAAAGVTLAGITLSADGTDADININITPKGTGSVVISKVDINDGTIDATDITIGASTTLVSSSGTMSIPQKTPINAEAATGTITVTGLPVAEVDNVYATGTITVTGTPVAEEVFLVDTQTFTFKATRTGLGEVTIDADNTVQASNIAFAINADITTVDATGNAGVVDLVSTELGTTGNDTDLSETATGIAVSGPKLTGGVDAVVGDTLTVGAQLFTFKGAGTATGDIVVDGNSTAQAANIVTSINRDLATVDATSILGVVYLSAATKGVTGNSLVLSKSCANITITGIGFLTGGIDGTIGLLNEICADTNYIYISTAANTISDSNWEKSKINHYSTIPEIDGSTSGILSISDVAGTIISNVGQGASDVALSLPQAESGYSLIATVGTAQAGNTWKLTAFPGDKIYLDGVAGTDGQSVVVTPAVGDYITLISFKTGTSTYDWLAKTGSGTWTAAA